LIKKAIYLLMVTGFIALGFTFGLQLLENGVFPLPIELSQQLKFGLIGLSALIGLILGVLLSPLLMRLALLLTAVIEQYLQKTPTQDLVMGSVGLILGLIIANLLGSVLSFLGWIGKVIWISLGIFSSFPKFGKERAAKAEVRAGNYKLLDTSVIIDGRISDLCESGFIEGILLVPAFILEELRHIADSPDLLKRNRGRRGLDILNKMRKELEIKVQVYDNVRGLEDVAEVDTKLVKLAQRLSAKILTNDYNLNKVAELHGVKVLNINELANAIKPVVLPGEEMVVQVVKDGKESGQGVAYLDDGTMIVVDGGRRYMNQTITVLVTSVLQTAAGRMIFAKPKSDKKGESGQASYNEVNVIG